MRLDAAALSEGNEWAEWWRSELERQGRRPAGGWPGTLSEARRRIAVRLMADFGRTFAATADELDHATHSAYAAAKRSWDQGCYPDDDPTSAGQ